MTPSTTLNSQMHAATLTKSGTVTKNPVMKLRRSQYISVLQPAARNRREHDHAEHDAIPGERREAGTPHDVQKRLDHQQRLNERHHEPHGDLQRALRRQVVPDLEQIFRERRSHRRHRHRSTQYR